MEQSDQRSMYTQSIDDAKEYLEYDIPMVSSDGEPHKLLIMVAVCSGIIVAIIVLLILIVMIDCRRRNNTQQKNEQEPKSVFTIFGHRTTDVCMVESGTNGPKSIDSNDITYRDSVIRSLSSKTIPGISTISC